MVFLAAKQQCSPFLYMSSSSCDWQASLRSCNTTSIQGICRCIIPPPPRHPTRSQNTVTSSGGPQVSFELHASAQPGHYTPQTSYARVLKIIVICFVCISPHPVGYASVTHTMCGTWNREFGCLRSSILGRLRACLPPACGTAMRHQHKFRSGSGFRAPHLLLFQCSLRICVHCSFRTAIMLPRLLSAMFLHMSHMFRSMCASLAGQRLHAIASPS